MYLVTVRKIEGREVAPYIIKMGRRRSLVPINMKIGKVTYTSRRIKKDEEQKYSKYKMIDIQYFKNIDRHA